MYFCDSEEAAYSFLKADFPEELHTDDVTVCHQAGDVAVAQKFRAWIKTVG